MKPKTRSLISLILCIIMVLSMVATSIVAFATQAYAAQDPKNISKVIVDLRSEEAFKDSGAAKFVQGTETEAQLYHGGKTSFDADKKAMKLEYFPDSSGKNGGAPYRLMVYVNRTGRLTEEYKYFVMVYQAKTEGTYNIELWNTPGQGVKTDIKTNGGDTQGKWVVSDAFDISAADANGKSILSRWAKDKNLNSIYIRTADANAEFYIKEIGFFKTKADADAYYASVNLENDPSEYLSAAEKAQLKKEAPATASGAGLKAVTYKTYTLEDYGLSEETEDDITGEAPAPVIMNFTNLQEMTGSGVYQTDHQGNTEGTFGFVKLEDGTGCVKLTYSDSDTGNWAKYRMMPAFSSGAPTAQHKYMRITYMTPDPMSATITVTNNIQSNAPITLVEDTSFSKGEWMISNAVDITGAGILQRYIDGKHCTIGYTATTESAVMYIKEIAFFATKEQAYSYYGDSETVTGSGMTAMTFGSEGTGTTVDNGGYGTYVNNDSDNTVDISYAEKTGHGVNYMVQVKYRNKDFADSTHRFIRVLYSAKHPEGVNPKVGMYMRNNGDGADIIQLKGELADTNGEFVLSDTALLSPNMVQRFTKENKHNSIWINSTIPGGEYRIKAVYFFPTRKGAEAFELGSGNVSVSILGNDISKYQIVLPEDKPYQLAGAADQLVAHIEDLCGVKLPIVTDGAPETAYEIILGLTDRKESKELYASMADKDTFKYEAKVMGNKLVIVSSSHFAAADGVDILLESFLYKGKTVVPEKIDVGALFDHTAKSSEMTKYNGWTEIGNVSDPYVLADDFSSDTGYFTEENNASDWSISGGKLTSKATDRALTYVHMYEANAVITAKLAYTAAGADGDMSLMLRYTAPDANVRAGYDFAAGEWYIESREGNDFPAIRLASLKAAITPGTEYLLTFTVDKTTATLHVNGEKLLTAEGITHVTPGRAAVCAEDAQVAADDAEIIFLSGQSTPIRNIVHTRLPDEMYREGGSVVELKDGTLIYQHAMTAGFKSTDSGKTWERLDALYFNTDATYPQILRLNNGDLLQIRKDSKGRYATVSKDDGITFERGGQINTNVYKDSKANNLNMNDKVTQMSDGRIFYVQNYNAGNKENAYLGKYQVFDAIYYSDDNGATWHESDTATFEMKGNEEMTHFAESKVIECADGTLRMYNSWNDYGCVVYSESKDNGVTWGEIVTVPELVCSRSSMQLMRDPYGETPTTYYMVWVNSVPENTKGSAMTRAGLTLAKTTDGKSWSVIGDIWRWNHNYKHEGALLAHIVDPFVQCTKDAILVGTGLAEYLPVNGDASASYHGAQRQHIWSISRETVSETARVMNRFTDVSLGAPYYDAVTYVSGEGLFNGTGDTTFSPDASMTRAMFVTVLGRLAKADVSAYATPTFNDVIAGQWYTSYVEWAAANGIVNGLGSGIYGINDNVTIQQACVILARYADYAVSPAVGTDVPGGPKSSADFADGASVASWAAKEVDWAIANGIYAPTGNLNPTSPASRATVATMFANYVKAYSA